jgi:beta-carotene 3-hydroxylase
MLHLILIVMAFFGMEAVAYASHRWIMHGFGWNWHESHHRIRHGWFEKNDLFGLVFSLIAITLIALGLMGPETLEWCWPLGVGMTLYGGAYLFLHDILVHQRFGIHLKPDNLYLRAVMRSHRVHHANPGKFDGSCFGFLWPEKPKRMNSLPSDSHIVKEVGQS